MTNDPALLIEELEERLVIVQEISAAQSRNLSNVQLSRGAVLEIVEIEGEIAMTGISDALAEALKQARARLNSATAGMAECSAKCAALERRLDDLDRRIATGGVRRSMDT